VRRERLRGTVLSARTNDCTLDHPARETGKSSEKPLQFSSSCQGDSKKLASGLGARTSSYNLLNFDFINREKGRNKVVNVIISCDEF
jgi:hypothetical protein